MFCYTKNVEKLNLYIGVVVASLAQTATYFFVVSESIFRVLFHSCHPERSEGSRSFSRTLFRM